MGVGWLLAIGRWLLAVSLWLLAVGGWLDGVFVVIVQLTVFMGYGDFAIQIVLHLKVWFLLT